MAGNTTRCELDQGLQFSGVIEPAEFAILLGDAWTMARFPANTPSCRRAWTEIFTYAGFVSDSGRFKPTDPLTVYRGSDARRRVGMAWTTNWRTARWYAERWKGYANVRQASVWTATVAPEQVLAMFDEQSESEVVLDTSRLKIMEAAA